jgi:hypothetical protein
MNPENPNYNESGSVRGESLFGTWFKPDVKVSRDKFENDPYTKSRTVLSKVLGVSAQELDKHFNSNASFFTKDYVKESKRNELTSLFSKDGAGILSSTKAVDNKGNEGVARDIVVKALGLDSDVDNVTLSKAMKDNGYQVTGKVVPNEKSAGGYRLNVAGHDIIVDMTPIIENKIRQNLATTEEKHDYLTHRTAAAKNTGKVFDTIKNGKPAYEFWNPKEEKMQTIEASKLDLSDSVE